MGGIVIIHNPFARGNIKRPWMADKLRRILTGCGELIMTRNINQVPAVAEQCLKNQVEYLGVNGGDGSLHIVLSAFISVYQDHPLPTIVAMRGGTMNTMANSVKIKGNTAGILKKLVEKYSSRQPINTIPQHLIRLNDKYGFMSGAGVPPNFLAAYYSGNSTGPWQALKTILHAIGSIMVQGPFYKFLAQPAYCRIVVDGEELKPRDFIGILACTIREIGLGFTFTPHAYDKPGHFQFLAATIKPLELVLQIPNLWMGKDLDRPDVISRITNNVHIEPLSNMRYTIDGELYETESPIEMSCGPTINLVKMES